MCGIVGLMSSKGSVSYCLVEALLSLQHRGQDAVGITTHDIETNKIHFQKKDGMVGDALNLNDLNSLKGHIGLGHVRYPTTGVYTYQDIQPFYVNQPYGIALVHNGNLVNLKSLSIYLKAIDLRYLETQSDSNVLLNIFSHLLYKEILSSDININNSTTLHPSLVFQAVKQLYNICIGSYSVICLIQGQGLVFFRDPHGIRPLIWGRKVQDKKDTENLTKIDYMVASESVALDVLDFELIGDLSPGEVIYINLAGQIYHYTYYSPEFIFTPCIFEYVYLARADSVMNCVSVYSARMNMGEKLAQKLRRELDLSKIDVIIPVPDTSRPAALKIATLLNKPYREGLIKNRYITRTFIMPNQKIRRQVIKRKFNVIHSEIRGKNILLIDDSIVRGNTAKCLIEIVRQAGAHKVYFASCAPPILYQNVYGIDIPTRKELIAISSNNDSEQIAKNIGADKVIYQDLNDLEDAIRMENPKLQQFETSIFNGHYITNHVTTDYLSSLELYRSNL